MGTLKYHKSMGTVRTKTRSPSPECGGYGWSSFPGINNTSLLGVCFVNLNVLYKYQYIEFFTPSTSSWGP